MPWMWRHIKTETRQPNGNWVIKRYPWRNEEPDGRLVETFQYTYELRSGEIQTSIASVYSERRERRRRMFWYIPFLAKVSTSIWVEFDQEMGERAGSWKGGTIGCGWRLLENETQEQALRDMESNRIFD